jgi:sodium transport system ATP-binding protein
MSDSEPAIRFAHVTRRFGTHVAVEDLCFEVRPGEILGLLGPNGAGKTTAMRMLATLMTPDEGTIHVAGHCTQREPLDVRRHLGFQTSDTGLYARLTPRENLQYFSHLHGLSSAEAADRIPELLERFDIGSFADQPCALLSSGQKQRTSLARTLLHQPPVVVLDEPTNGLDIMATAFLLDAIQTLAREGVAVLLSTHIVSDIEMTCPRVLILHEGRRRFEGTPAALCEATGTATLSRGFLRIVTYPRHTP